MFRDNDGFKDLDGYTWDCLNKVFTALDAYCDDPDSMCEFEIDEVQLRKEIGCIADHFVCDDAK